jgi:hypothetical protein
MPGELAAVIAALDITDQLDAYAGWRLIGTNERTRHNDDIDRARTEWTRRRRCSRIARRLIKAGRVKP